MNKKNKMISLIVVGIIVATPFLVGGGVFAYCGIKDVRMNRLADDISEKADASELDLSIFRVSKNGDCLTGNGAGFIFDINEKYESPITAKDDIFTKLSAAGIDTPPKEQQGNISAKSLKGSSGGNTPIEVINMSFSYEGNSMNVDFELKDKAECTVTETRQVICEGVSKEQLIDYIVENSAVNSITVDGNINL